ncbi:MAG TPA: hypothetical protein VFG59_12670, partial [Anaeromyxobacter sp.]|nr:hypothetical protein [Anaeromyxobacter sp.]
MALWVLPFALLGMALVHFYPDSYQQDGGYHYFYARWAFEHPRNLVGVWARPLFTTLYALPARLGYPVAKLMTVVVSLATAWQTGRLARESGMKRAELAVPLLVLQPSFLLIFSDTMTEPLFALVLAVALRLHRAGRLSASMWVASLLPLARPEGFFVGVLWGLWVLFDPRAGRSLVLRSLSTLQLAGGVAAWWAAAYGLTGSPRFIIDNWPANWAGAAYGTGPLWHYWVVRNEILAGPALWILFGLGAVSLVLHRRALLPLACLALIAGLHSVFYRLGMFGSAGYARYLVCVAPPFALATLAGWNTVAHWLERVPGLVTRAAGAAVLVWAAVLCLKFVDRFGSSRDAGLVARTHAWFEAHPRPLKRLVFSQAYMAIVFG